MWLFLFTHLVEPKRVENLFPLRIIMTWFMSWLLENQYIRKGQVSHLKEYKKYNTLGVSVRPSTHPVHCGNSISTLFVSSLKRAFISFSLEVQVSRPVVKVVSWDYYTRVLQTFLFWKVLKLNFANLRV